MAPIWKRQRLGYAVSWFSNISEVEGRQQRCSRKDSNPVDPRQHMPHPGFYQKPSPWSSDHPLLLTYVLEGFSNNVKSVFQLEKYLTKIIAKPRGHNKEKNESLTWFYLQVGSFAKDQWFSTADKPNLKTSCFLFMATLAPVAKSRDRHWMGFFCHIWPNFFSSES